MMVCPSLQRILLPRLRQKYNNHRSVTGFHTSPFLPFRHVFNALYQAFQLTGIRFTSTGNLPSLQLVMSRFHLQWQLRNVPWSITKRGNAFNWSLALQFAYVSSDTVMHATHREIVWKLATNHQNDWPPSWGRLTGHTISRWRIDCVTSHKNVRKARTRRTYKMVASKPAKMIFEDRKTKNPYCYRVPTAEYLNTCVLDIATFHTK